MHIIFGTFKIQPLHFTRIIMQSVHSKPLTLIGNQHTYIDIHYKLVIPYTTKMGWCPTIPHPLPTDHQPTDPALTSRRDARALHNNFNCTTAYK